MEEKIKYAEGMTTKELVSEVNREINIIHKMFIGFNDTLKEAYDIALKTKESVDRVSGTLERIEVKMEQAKLAFSTVVNDFKEVKTGFAEMKENADSLSKAFRSLLKDKNQ